MSDSAFNINDALRVTVGDDFVAVIELAKPPNNFSPWTSSWGRKRSNTLTPMIGVGRCCAPRGNISAQAQISRLVTRI